MRLARVITGLDQYSGELTLELLKQGFEVQTSSTSETSSVTPDLEITLNQCAPDAAGTLIGDSPGTRDMCVFVTPQAMAGHIRSIDIFVLTPKEKPQGEITVIPGEISKPAEAKVLPFENVSSRGPTTGTLQSEPAEIKVVSPAPVPISSERTDDFDLVPRGMIWQASNEEELSSQVSDPPEAHSVLHFMPQEENQFVATIRSLVSAVIKFSDSKLQRMRTSTAKARMGAMFQVSKWFKTAGQKPRKPVVVLPISTETSAWHKPAHPYNLDEPESSNWKVPRDTRLWNAMGMAVAASLVALIVVSIAEHYSASRISASSSTTAMGPAPSLSAPKLDQAPAGKTSPPTTTGKLSPTRVSVPILSKNNARVATTPTLKRDSRPHRNLDADYVAKDTTVYFDRRSGFSKANRLPHN